MNPIRMFIARRRKAARDRLINEYASHELGTSSTLAIQLAKFNRCWQSIQQNIPFYARLRDARKLPDQFESWEQFVSTVPIADRAHVYANLELLSDPSHPPDFYRTTGGSTAEPISLPAWRAEFGETEPNEWLGRGWWNIEPGDASFRIWGHSHLLGRGVRGWLNANARTVKDRILGTERISAYDLSIRAIKTAFLRLQKSKATYILGYSGALDRFARTLKLEHLCNRHILKAIVATSESFPRDDSIAVIEETLGAPVAMEYGCVEAGAIAHTDKTGNYRVFWLSYFIEATEPAPTGGYKMRITSLYPRCFPLLRYEVGDAVLLDHPTTGVTAFPVVVGRSNDFINIKSGGVVHPEAISHAVKGTENVTGYQLIQSGDAFTLLLTAANDIKAEEISVIRAKLLRINQGFSGVTIRVVDQLKQTKAGKTPMIIRE